MNVDYVKTVEYMSNRPAGKLITGYGLLITPFPLQNEK